MDSPHAQIKHFSQIAHGHSSILFQGVVNWHNQTLTNFLLPAPPLSSFSIVLPSSNHLNHLNINERLTDELFIVFRITSNVCVGVLPISLQNCMISRSWFTLLTPYYLRPLFCSNLVYFRLKCRNYSKII